MWEQFWVQNIHYVLEVFVGFLMLTAAWILLDGWLIERKAKSLIRAIGFFLLMVWSFLAAAPAGFVGIEKIINVELFIDIIGLSGFGAILLSFLIDPVPTKPGKKLPRILSLLWPDSFPVIIVGSLASIKEVLQKIIGPLLPTLGLIGLLFTEAKVWTFLFAAIIAFFVWLHYTKGIQSEWKYLYLGFLFFAVALGLATTSVWRNSSNVLIARLFAPYNIVWIIEHIIKFIGAALLGAWAWGFIRFRMFPQLFSSFIALSFIIFLATSIIYTGFLLTRTQRKTIEDLEINVKTLNFAFAKVKESAILAARLVSNNPQIREAVKIDDKEVLFSNLNTLMFQNETDFMLVVNSGGEVLMRAEDRERYGDSLAEDSVVWRALDGKAVVTSATEQGIAMPVVSIKASSPIVNISEGGDPEILGAVVTGYLLDLAFVDGIKKITDLDITVFANSTISATTFTMPESQTRSIGAHELDQKILNTVLKEGNSYTGSVKIFNRPFLAAYIPINDIEETTIGMLFTGRSQALILSAASATMRLTFSISILLMILSVLPLWWLAKFISYHQKI